MIREKQHKNHSRQRKAKHKLEHPKRQMGQNQNCFDQAFIFDVLGMITSILHELWRWFAATGLCRKLILILFAPIVFTVKHMYVIHFSFFFKWCDCNSFWYLTLKRLCCGSKVFFAVPILDLRSAVNQVYFFKNRRDCHQCLLLHFLLYLNL